MSWARADALQSKALMGKHRTGTGGMQCHQSYLWTQSSYLAHRLTTVRATANIPPWMWKAADMFRLLCPVFYFIFLRSDMMGGQRKLESGVKFHCSQEAKKITFFLKTHLQNYFPSSSWLNHMGMLSYWLESWWKEQLCCYIKHNTFLTQRLFKKVLDGDDYLPFESNHSFKERNNVWIICLRDS